MEHENTFFTHPDGFSLCERHYSEWRKTPIMWTLWQGFKITKEEAKHLCQTCNKAEVSK